MGDIIEFYKYKKPLVEMLLHNESPEKVEYLKDLAYKYFADGNISLGEEIQKEYGSRFNNCYLTYEHGEILLVYKDIPYLIWIVDDTA